MRLLLLLLLLLTACVPKRPPVTILPPPPGLDKVLLDRVTEVGNRFYSLQGLAKVRLHFDGKSRSASQVILAEKPDHLRAETLSPFGQPLLLLASDGAELSVYVPGDGRFFRGEASAANLRRFARLPLQVEDLVRILLYQVPLIPYAGDDLSATVDGGYELVLYGDAGVRQVLEFNPQQQLVRSAYFHQDALQLEIGYDDFSGAGGAFPTAVSLTMPLQQSAATLVFSEVETNMPIPGDRFLLHPPAGTAVLPIP